MHTIAIREKGVCAEQQVRPILDPAKEGLLFYAVSYQGHPCPTLLDCGATHSFFAHNWLRDRGLPTKHLPKPIGVGLFDGPAAQSIRETCHIPHVVLGTLDVPWTFLVFEKSEHQAILGLDFIQAHGLLYDPRTDLLITLRKSPQERPSNPELCERAEEPDQDNLTNPEEGEALLCHLSIPEQQWASGGLFDTSSSQVVLDLSGDRETVILCSVTADTEEEEEELRKA